MQRLTRPEQFTAVLTQGRRLGGKSFLVQAQPNDATGPRLGIIAGRRAIPKAVDRNRSKRLVREIFREYGQALGALDVVVLCRQLVPPGGKALARRELTRLFAALGGGVPPSPVANRQEIKR